MSESKPGLAQQDRRTGSADLASPTRLVKVVIAQASFIAALMFYLGVIYTSAYYDYYHLSPFALGFGFAEFALQSLNLVTFPVLAGAVVLLVAAALAARRSHRALPEALVRCHVLVVAAGLLLLVLWWQWGLLLSYRWAGPLLIALGLLLGVAPHDGLSRPTDLRDTAVPILAAGVFLFWTVTVVAGQLGHQHAMDAARHINRRTGLIVFSAEKISLGPALGLQFHDLGPTTHLRYRYMGLRLITERDGRYYAVPSGWRARTDSVYVLRESNSVRFEFTPGVVVR